MRGKNDPAAFRGKQTEIDQKFIHVSNSEYSSRTGESFDRPDLRLEGARPSEQLTKGLRLRINNTKILSTQKAKRITVKTHGYLSQVWLNSQNHRQEMEVFGFPCQAISMLKLQKTLHGVLQRRKANSHSPEKKIAVSFLLDSYSVNLSMNSLEYFHFIYLRN